ncbi:MAG: hypothetical protein ACRDYX_23060, partial [Egibacteraceae bacterium]
MLPGYEGCQGFAEPVRMREAGEGARVLSATELRPDVVITHHVDDVHRPTAVRPPTGTEPVTLERGAGGRG